MANARLSLLGFRIPTVCFGMSIVPYGVVGYKICLISKNRVIGLFVIIVNSFASVEFPDIPEGEEAGKNENGAAKDDEEDDDDDDENEGQLLQIEFDINRKDSGTATKESRAYEAMSSLVNYIQPVR